jgi:primosomal protein N' (replication factor Y)
MNAPDRGRQAALFDAGHPPEPAPAAVGPFAGVVLNRPVDQVFSYKIPGRLREKVRPGARVRVPLGKGDKPAVAYCVGVDEALPEGVPAGRVKEVVEVLDDPPLIDAPMLDLTRWMAGYYACSWGQALDAVVPAGVKKAAGTAMRTYLVVPEETYLVRDTLKLPTKQADVLALLCRARAPMTLDDARRLANCTNAPIDALRKAGLIHTARRRTSKAAALEEPPAPDEPPRPRAEPTGEQRAALDALGPALDGDGFGVFLLHGVTGSGKTEVYLDAIERAVARGREAIVLVPEISLTPQTIRRFRRRFTRVAVLHSHLTDAERHRHWRSIAQGEVQVVVGARSAVFAPARRLGLIVIDEEHESTFKQETAPRYHARDVAVKRAQMLGIPVILGSATPALETWRNAESGRYTRVALTKRVADRPMPEVAIIDLRHEKPEPGVPPGGLSGPLVRAMQAALDDRGQVILLLNRRGYHTFILCPQCGHVCKCDACDVALTHHKGRRRALCHTCDAEFDPPERCPACRHASLHYGGIGTERLEREVKSAFPDRVVRRMDSDTMRSPGSHEKVLEAFKNGQVEILLGTQMIAKGLDFPDVTLVGVINADTALHLPDFRAAERTFQLVAQVAGRTGRGDRPGRVLVQTFCPDDPAIAFASHHDYLGFVAQELPKRRDHGVPPFGRLVRLIVRGADESASLHYLQALSAALAAEAPPTVKLLGPAPAPVVKIRNLFRFHLQLRAPSPKPLQDLLKSVIPQHPAPHGVELAVDVDPVSLL